TPVRALHTAGDGTVWAATDEGLSRLVGGHLQPVPLGGPRLRQITAIASGRSGMLWVCDDARGVVRIAGGRAEPIAAATDSISARPILTYVDTEGRLWIAFQGGILRM